MTRGLVAFFAPLGRSGGGVSGGDWQWTQGGFLPQDPAQVTIDVCIALPSNAVPSRSASPRPHRRYGVKSSFRLAPAGFAALRCAKSPRKQERPTLTNSCSPTGFWVLHSYKCPAFTRGTLGPYWGIDPDLDSVLGARGSRQPNTFTAQTPGNRGTSSPRTLTSSSKGRHTLFLRQPPPALEAHNAPLKTQSPWWSESIGPNIGRMVFPPCPLSGGGFPLLSPPPHRAVRRHFPKSGPREPRTGAAGYDSYQRLPNPRQLGQCHPPTIRFLSGPDIPRPGGGARKRGFKASPPGPGQMPAFKFGGNMPPGQLPLVLSGLPHECRGPRAFCRTPGCDTAAAPGVFPPGPPGRPSKSHSGSVSRTCSSRFNVLNPVTPPFLPSLPPRPETPPLEDNTGGTTCHTADTAYNRATKVIGPREPRGLPGAAPPASSVVPPLPATPPSHVFP
ncbi:leucine-rich repeat extensin-like protein 5, partial [Penaeus monodon]|uniref:leucine-rich repeat extensin-like protein 5 n=1 Tax=Penaeus monodon TaxID=6687 RepID=UPI0018A6DA45